MIRFFIVFIGLLVYCIISFTHSVYASPNFSTIYDQTYNINEDSSTTVTQTFTITNLTTEVLANKSVIFLPFKDISNISAHDPSGPLKTQTSQTNSGLTLTVTFNSPAAGVGQKYSWDLFFKTSDLVKKYGFSSDIVLPQLQLSEPASDFQVRVALKNDNLGKLILAWPKNSAELRWTKADLFGKNVHLIYSTSKTQTYNLALKYHLDNKKLYPTILEIPLPPNSSFQKVIIGSISPRPLDVIKTKSGSFLAKYYLGASSSQDINVEVFIENEQPSILTQGLSPLAPSEKAYNSVIASFKSENSCQDEIKALSTMLKNAGMETRYLFGLVYPDNKRLHCWLEFFDRQTNSWHEVDPNLQINGNGDYYHEWDPYHLVLSITNPLEEIGIPLSEINFKASLEPLPSDIVKLSYLADFPPQIFSGFNYSGKVTISNDSGEEFPNLEIIPMSQFLKPKTAKIIVGDLPPYARREIRIDFVPGSWTFTGDDIISLSINEKAYSYPVKLVPIYTSPAVLLGGGIVFIAVIFTLTKFSRSLLFQKRKR